jgi:hypothetical protein
MIIIIFAQVLKDVPMPAEQRRTIVGRIAEQFPAVEFVELPALVYQALLLTARGSDKACRRLVLTAFTAHFADVSANLVARAADLASTRRQFSSHDEEKLSQVDTEAADEALESLESSMVENSARALALRHVEATVVHHFNFAIKQVS